MKKESWKFFGTLWYATATSLYMLLWVAYVVTEKLLPDADVSGTKNVWINLAFWLVFISPSIIMWKKGGVFSKDD